MGITATLILVILLTQSRLFDFLTETPLGRMFLLAFVILISYTNKILGLLAVLVIIIAFSQHDMNIVQSYTEGYRKLRPSTTAAAAAAAAAREAAEEARAAADRQAQEARAAEAAAAAAEAAQRQSAAEAANRQAAAAAAAAEEAARAAQRQQAQEAAARAAVEAAARASLAQTSQSGSIKSVNPITSVNPLGGREGFCMTDRETNMLRGKQSNTIPVFNNSREQDDDISPSDKSVFTNLFSTF